MKILKVAITGHRPNKLGNDYDLKSKLINNIRGEIIEYLNMLVMTRKVKLKLITGMALGIDTLFALVAIEMKIPFIAAIPCWNQDKMWTPKSKKLYSDILSNKLCKVHIVTLSEYTQECMQSRNKWMVNNSNLLIAVWDGTSGGTANCVKYANSKCCEILRINPANLI